MVKAFQKLDIRGHLAEDALRQLEQYLDRALLSNAEGVEIVHGRGTGALRKAVHNYLKSHPQIDSYKIANEDTGGDGVTIAIFR